MTIVLRVVAVLLVLLGALLIYAVINALLSDEGARAGVAIAYTIGGIVAFYAAAKLWSRPAPTA